MMFISVFCSLIFWFLFDKINKCKNDMVDDSTHLTLHLNKTEGLARHRKYREWLHWKFWCSRSWSLDHIFLHKDLMPFNINVDDDDNAIISSFSVFQKGPLLCVLPRAAQRQSEQDRGAGECGPSLQQQNWSFQGSGQRRPPVLLVHVHDLPPQRRCCLCHPKPWQVLGQRSVNDHHVWQLVAGTDEIKHV